MTAPCDTYAAGKIEPLEQVVAGLVREVKTRHIARLQAGVCTIEYGFAWPSDNGRLLFCCGRGMPRPYKKASPSGLRPQARVGAQPPQAALSAETEAVREAD